LFLIGCFIYNKINKKQGTWDKTYHFEFSPRVNTSPSGVNTRPNSDSKGETECRRVLTELFNKPFEKVRPSFLNNPVTGGNHNLELDCFNAELGLACEYNGAQHYKYIPFFHRNKEAFMNQKYRDDLKRRLCKEAGVILIEVPYTVKNIKSYIYNQLKFA
jgi:hypothetical protein